MDSHKAAFLGKVFKDIKVHEEIQINSGGKIGWAMRKNSPQLKEVVNNFVKKNKKLFSFASYNAGPAKISKLRKEAKSMNLDPNVWFHNVEVVAAKRIGRETVQYVANIFKYYIAYTLISNQKEGKDVWPLSNDMK